MDDHLTEIASSGETDDNRLPLYFYDLTPQLKEQAEKELFENDTTMQLALDELRILLAGENCMNFPTCDKDLIPFLRYRKYNVKRAYITYKTYFSQFSQFDHFYKNFDFASVLKIAKSNAIGFMPKRDVDGTVIGIGLTKNWKASEMDATDIMKAGTIMFMDLLRCPVTQITGVKLIIDCSHLSLRTILTVRPWHLQFAIQYVQNSAPIRFKECHILHHGPFFHAIWKLVTPIAPQKFLKRVHFHGNDVNRLRAYFSPSVLPEEFGGNMGPWSNDECVENLLKSENLIMDNIRKFRTKTSD